MAIIMKITQNKNGNTLTIAVEGRIDTATSKEFEEKSKADLNGVESLILDFSALNYISSAGLRVLLSLQKIMNKQGSMKITGANDIVKDIFEVTGFSEILDVE